MSERSEAQRLVDDIANIEGAGVDNRRLAVAETWISHLRASAFERGRIAGFAERDLRDWANESFPGQMPTATQEVGKVDHFRLGNGSNTHDITLAPHFKIGDTPVLNNEPIVIRPGEAYDFVRVLVDGVAHFAVGNRWTGIPEVFDISFNGRVRELEMFLYQLHKRGGLGGDAHKQIVEVLGAQGYLDCVTAEATENAKRELANYKRS